MKKIITMAAISVISMLSANIALAATPTNLIINPSVEQTASSSLPTLYQSPVGWNKTHDSKNLSFFFYPVQGHNSPKAIMLSVYYYRQNKEGWYFNNVNIDPSKQYAFSDYYISNKISYISANFQLSDGSSVQTELGQIPASSKWAQATETITPPAGAVSVTVFHYLKSVGNLTTDDYSLTQIGSVVDTTPPVITLIGSAKVSVIVGSTYTDAGATASDNIDGNITSKIVTVNPVDTSKVGTYIITYNVSDTAGNKATQVTREVDVTSAVTNISASIQDPVAGMVLSHAILIKATAQSTNPIKQIQFYIDGSPIGLPVLTSPSQSVLDTTQFPDGPHSLGATATDNQSNSSTMAKVLVNFSNAQIVNPNLISNAALENGASSPTDWLNSSWGTNDATFTYPVTGHTGNGAGITITSYTSGDAKWYFKDVNVLPGIQYIFSDYYKSDVPTAVVARYTLSDGSVSYGQMGATTPAANWTKFSSSFVTPDNVVSVTIFHIIQSVGSLSVDDYYLGQANSLPFSQGMVSLNFDDGTPSFYANGLPILTSHGLTGTDYIISGELGNSDSITVAQMLQLQTLGYEIGDHTKTHVDLTTLTQPQIVDEVTNSKTDLEALGVNPITTFAYPYGTWNNLTDQVVKQSGYLGARTALVQDGGPNFRDGNPFLLRTMSVESTTTLAQVKAWIDRAIADKTWIILVFHGIDTTTDQYSTTPTELNAIADYLKSSNIKTVTNAEGVYLMTHR